MTRMREARSLRALRQITLAAAVVYCLAGAAPMAYSAAPAAPQQQVKKTFTLAEVLAAL